MKLVTKSNDKLLQRLKKETSIKWLSIDEKLKARNDEMVVIYHEILGQAKLCFLTSKSESNSINVISNNSFINYIKKRHN